MTATTHADLLQPAVLATVEAFQAHANLTARPGKPSALGEVESFSTEVTVSFEISGSVHGRMELCFSKSTAIRLGAALSGIASHTLNDFGLESLRLLARGWADCARSMLGPDSTRVSPPDLLVSPGATGTSAPESSRVTVPFHFALGEFTLHAELRRDPEIFP